MTPDELRAAIPEALTRHAEAKARPRIDYARELQQMAAKAVVETEGADLIVELLEQASTLLASHMTPEGVIAVLSEFVRLCHDKSDKFQHFSASFDTMQVIDRAKK